MKTSAIWLLLALSAATASDTNLKYARKELEWGKPINLEDFGGPHLEIIVSKREMTYVTAATLDYTKLIPVPKKAFSGFSVDENSGRVTEFYSTSRYDMRPTTKRITVEKKNGIPFPSSNSTMYLLYREPTTGIQVYFLDAISPQNHDSIVVASGKLTPPQSQPQISFPPSLLPPSTPSPNKKQSDQPISAELFTWYVALQKERLDLDTSNPEAVAQFNLNAAAYHDALKKARSTRGK